MRRWFIVVLLLLAALTPRARARAQAPPPASDFRVGDRILLRVDGEQALSDTFVVRPGPQLELPAIGAVPLAGVTHAGLEPYLAQYLARYINAPVVHAHALMRLGVTGEVAKPGFYAVRSDALLSTVLMDAGGPTKDARLDRLSVRRADAPSLGSDTVRKALDDGFTVAQLGLHSGDELIVPRAGDVERTVRIVGILVTIPLSLLAIAKFR